MTPVERIEAALDEAEKLAHDALHPDAVKPGSWSTENHNSRYHSEPNTCHIAEDRRGNYWTVASEVFIPNAEHIALWDPAMALRQIQHARDVLARHRYEHWCQMVDTDGESLYSEFFDDEKLDCPEVTSLLSTWCPDA